MRHPIFFSLIFVLLPTAPFAAADQVGRLFLTPQQRQTLERIRQGDATETTVEPGAVKRADSDVTLDGYVTHNGSRKSTVWINSLPQYGAEKPQDAAAIAARKNASSIELMLPSGRNVRLKAGQSVDVATGRILDVFESGILVPGSAAPPAAPHKQ